LGLTVLIEIGIILVIILAILFFTLFSLQKRGKNLSKQTTLTKDLPTLHSLSFIIHNKKSTNLELKKSMEYILKYYGTIQNLDIYNDILYQICIHPNTDKNLILTFDKELKKLNPQYKQEINSAISEGLSSRK